MKYILTILFVAVICLNKASYAITLKEAIESAKNTLPSYKANLFKSEASRQTYKSTFSSYLPTLSFKSSELRTEEQRHRSYGIALNYILFDGGSRSAQRQMSALQLEIDEQELNKKLLDIQYAVKTLFYKTIALYEIVNLRKIQLKDAQTDYDVAEGRRQAGVAKLSDVLQAQVRLKQAEYNLITAEGELKKSLFEFNSLCGRDLNSAYDLEGNLDWEAYIPDIKAVMQKVLAHPEIVQAKKNVEIALKNKKNENSRFYPTITATASYDKTLFATNSNTKPESKSINFGVSWNIFELAKFYKSKTYEYEHLSSQERFNELIRNISLELHKLFQDLLTAQNKMLVAKEQLTHAQHNYTQALGQYKVGKADILFLVQAEAQLASSREQVIDSKLALLMQKFKIEHFASISNLEDIK